MILMITKIIFIGTAIALSVLILLQQSKGAGMGASFGAGASGTVFGARGAGSFLYKATRALAIVFFVSALAMGYLQNKVVEDSVIQQKQLDVKKAEADIDVPLVGKDNSPASDTTIPLEKESK